jgi:hypothetical protein
LGLDFVIKLCRNGLGETDQSWIPGDFTVVPSLESNKHLPRNLWAILIFISLIGQFILLFEYFAHWADKLQQYKDRSALIKSAAFSWDPIFAEYSQFLKDRIPTDARVILPPRNVGIPTDHVGYMQYILFPREIHNCGPHEVVACIKRVQGGDSYILAVPGFPPKELMETQNEFIQFSDEWGVYVPIP